MSWTQIQCNFFDNSTINIKMVIMRIQYYINYNTIFSFLWAEWYEIQLTALNHGSAV